MSATESRQVRSIPGSTIVLALAALLVIWAFGLRFSRPVVLHTHGEPGLSAAARSAHWPDMRVDINRASVAELQLLPGIGPALAKRIVEARRERPFASIDDLRQVSAIGPVILERLEPYAFIDGHEEATAAAGAMPGQGDGQKRACGWRKLGLARGQRTG